MAWVPNAKNVFYTLAGIAAIPAIVEGLSRRDSQVIMGSLVVLAIIGMAVFLLVRRLKRDGGVTLNLPTLPKLRRAPRSSGKATPPPAGTGTITRQYQLNYFDPGENSNKVWIGIAHGDGGFETRFGRVRDAANLVSSRKLFATQTAAENELERKRREKLRKGYKDTIVVDIVYDTSQINLRYLAEFGVK